MDIIRAIEQQQIKDSRPRSSSATHVKVHYRIKEGNRERIQVFQGDVIRRQRSLLPARPSPSARSPSALALSAPSRCTPPRSTRSRSCVTVDVRRAKLYYLRDKVGKAAKIKEKAF